MFLSLKQILLNGNKSANDQSNHVCLAFNHWRILSGLWRMFHEVLQVTTLINPGPDRADLALFVFSIPDPPGMSYWPY